MSRFAVRVRFRSGNELNLRRSQASRTVFQASKRPEQPAWRVSKRILSEFRHIELNHLHCAVVWVPDEGLLAASADEQVDVSQQLSSLELFKPEEWGLPPYDE